MYNLDHQLYSHDYHIFFLTTRVYCKNIYWEARITNKRTIHGVTTSTDPIKWIHFQRILIQKKNKTYTLSGCPPRKNVTHSNWNDLSKSRCFRKTKINDHCIEDPNKPFLKTHHVQQTSVDAYRRFNPTTCKLVWPTNNGGKKYMMQHIFFVVIFSDSNDITNDCYRFTSLQQRNIAKKTQ